MERKMAEDFSFGMIIESMMAIGKKAKSMAQEFSQITKEINGSEDGTTIKKLEIGQKLNQVKILNRYYNQKIIIIHL